MFIKKVASKQIGNGNRTFSFNICPYCNEGFLDKHPAAIVKHTCDGEEIYLLNGHAFVGVPNYNFEEAHSHDGKPNR